VPKSACTCDTCSPVLQVPGIDEIDASVCTVTLCALTCFAIQHLGTTSSGRDRDEQGRQLTTQAIPENVCQLELVIKGVDLLACRAGLRRDGTSPVTQNSNI